MGRQIQNFDYYSKYIGETGIQFSTAPAENEIYIFKMWTGYSDFLFQKLYKTHNVGLPIFLKNWNEQIGWMWENITEKISEAEIDWLIFTLKIIKSDLEQKPDEVGYFDTNCLVDLIFFLESVKESKLELEISDDY